MNRELDLIIEGAIILSFSAAIGITIAVAVALMGCALEPDYGHPEPFCSQVLECWQEADDTTQCKWDWPNDWQWAEAVALACEAGQETCEEMLEECNAFE